MLAPLAACAALPSNLTTLSDMLSQAKHDVFTENEIYRERMRCLDCKSR